MRPLFPTIVTSLLVVYAYLRSALTPGGIVAAIATAAITAFHPWGVFFTLLVSFFLAGTLVTKLAHVRKSALLAPSRRTQAKAEPRNAIQVFCNSLPMTLLTGAHGLYMHFRLAAAPEFLIALPRGQAYDRFWFPPVCLPKPTSTEVGLNPFVGKPPFKYIFMNTLPYAICAGYAAVAADTFASEIGMMMGSKPFLVTSMLKGRFERVPHGTNGGVTIEGILASAVGAAIMGVVAVYATPLCKGTGPLGMVESRAAHFGIYQGDGIGDSKRWASDDELWFILYMTVAGVVGAFLDSIIGALYQVSIVDGKTGRIVEGEGGKDVDTTSDKVPRKVIQGTNMLSNNGVNFLMALSVCVGTTAVMTFVTQ